MAKASDLMSRFGANVAESMGAGRQSRGAMVAEAKPDPEDGTERLRSAAVIEVDRIVPDPNQPRTDFDDTSIQELADSLREHGQIQPIAVQWNGEMGRYIIVAGERRWRATLKAGRKTIDAIILDGARSESDILQLQLIENCLREGLRPIEQGRAFRKLMDRNGWSGDQLARTLHISDASVFRALALLTLPDEVQGHVERGALTPATAYEVSKLDDPEAQREVAARVVAGGMNRAETIQAVREVAQTTRGSAKGKQGRGAKPKVKLPTERTIRTTTGHKVTVAGRKGFDGVTLVQALEEALATARAEIAGERGEAA
jgi:ParB family transcriptional regulator, chromosome partitioning protein